MIADALVFSEIIRQWVLLALPSQWHSAEIPFDAGLSPGFVVCTFFRDQLMNSARLFVYLVVY